MKQVFEIIKGAGNVFRERLESIEKQHGHLPQDAYVRYLSMQYHLTKGVQRHFMMCASHPDFAHRVKLREFLVRFANEEELHFKVAEKDLENMGLKPLPICLDTRLWWAFFDTQVMERPLVRLGATCVLENIADHANDVINRLLSKSPYLNPRNMKFITIHRHGAELPHGDQILEALESAQLEPAQWDQVVEGANIGVTLYLRQAHWALTGDLLR